MQQHSSQPRAPEGKVVQRRPGKTGSDGAAQRQEDARTGEIEIRRQEGAALPVIALILLACAGSATAASYLSTAQEPNVTTTLTPASHLVFEEGPPITPPEALLAWLKAGKGRIVQLPVTVTFNDEQHLEVAQARVGSEQSGLRLKLDDGAMGISLLDHLRTSCPAGPTCRVWLEGTWGRLMMGMPGVDDSAPGYHHFTVRRFVGIADGSALRARGAKE